MKYTEDCHLRHLDPAPTVMVAVVMLTLRCFVCVLSFWSHGSDTWRNTGSSDLSPPFFKAPALTNARWPFCALLRRSHKPAVVPASWFLVSPGSGSQAGPAHHCCHHLPHRCWWDEACWGRVHRGQSGGLSKGTWNICGDSSSLRDRMGGGRPLKVVLDSTEVGPREGSPEQGGRSPCAPPSLSVGFL